MLSLCVGAVVFTVLFFTALALLLPNRPKWFSLIVATLVLLGIVGLIVSSGGIVLLDIDKPSPTEAFWSGWLLPFVICVVFCSYIHVTRNFSR